MLDELDRKLISALSRNARTSLVELSSLLGVSNTAVKKRLKKLEEAGIILGYTVRLNKRFFQGPLYLHILHVPNEKVTNFTRFLLSRSDVEHSFQNVAGNNHIFYVFSTSPDLGKECKSFCKAALVSRVEEVF